jgi:hypothetical protein
VQHRPREAEAARIVRLHDEREGVDVTELRAANRARIQCGRWSGVRQWVARQGSLDKLAYGLTGVEVAGSPPFILSNVALDGLAAPDGRARLVDRIGLVLDDSNDFTLARRSFVPETPDLSNHM